MTENELSIVKDVLETARLYALDAANGDGGLFTCEIGHRLDYEAACEALSIIARAKPDEE